MKRIVIIMIIHILAETGIGQSSQLDSILKNIAAKYSIVGMSVLVTSHDSVVFSQGYGQRDLTRKLPVNPQTKYRIASISKFITATAIMQLYEKGLFRLDDDVSNYLGFILRNPAFSSQPITFRMLLSHTGSVRDGSGYDAFLSASYNNNPPPALSGLLVPGGSYYTADMFSSSKSPQSKYFQYSNINFGILGTLIERISGERFDEYCQTHVFQPLAISGSFNINDVPDINDVAVLYRKSGSTWQPQADNYQGQYPAERDLSGYVIGTNGILFAPQGGLRASADDLSKFMLSHLNGGEFNGVRILNDSTISLMHQSNWIFNESNGNNYYGIFNEYGLGNHRTTDLLPQEIMFGHPGEAYGLISDLYFSTESDYGIIFITNGGLWGSGTYSGWYNVEEEIFQACYAELPELTSAIDQDENLPKSFGLEQNYPNPFNAETVIPFSIDESGRISLTLYDILGNRVAVLVDSQHSAGRYQVKLTNPELSSGIYFCLLHSGKAYARRKIVLLR